MQPFQNFGLPFKGREIMHHQNKYRLKRNVWIPWEMLESPAFSKLSASGIRVLLRFLQKRTWSKTGSRKRKIVFNVDELVFTYEEAMHHMGISSSQYHTIIKKLVEVGFIDLKHQGGAYGRDYSRYGLSERWRHYGTPLFQKVEKKRIVLPGRDVHSRKIRQTKKVTGNRNSVITEIRNVNGNRDISGYRETVTTIDPVNPAETIATKEKEPDRPFP